MKEVLRTCLACREKKDKRELFRVVREPNGNVALDESGRKNGRGVYVCKNSKCISKAQKSKVFDRQLEVDVPQSIYDSILKQVEK